MKNTVQIWDVRLVYCFCFLVWSFLCVFSFLLLGLLMCKSAYLGLLVLWPACLLRLNAQLDCCMKWSTTGEKA